MSEELKPCDNYFPAVAACARCGESYWDHGRAPVLREETSEKLWAFYSTNTDSHDLQIDGELARVAVALLRDIYEELKP